MRTRLLEQSPTDQTHARARIHLSLGWWSLLFFLMLGMLLELLHGLKLGFYLDVSNETRRFLWTLSHAHGTLLALINLAFAVCLQVFEFGPRERVQLASRCLIGATVLLPMGFFLGGTVIYDGDPGLGVALVPIGGVLLAIAVLLTARGAPDGKT